MRRIAIPERTDWRDTARSFGFRFHTIDGEPYWDESAYYAFSLRQIEDDLEDPTTELHEMAMGLVGEIVQSEELMDRLAVPAGYRDWIAESWRRGEPHLYGRMDLAYDGKGPAKLFELNYDTPTALYEAAFFQWVWLEQQQARGQLPESADQYNLIQDLLVETFATIAPDLPKPLYFSAVRDSLEDQGTVAYLRDCAEQAGIDTRSIAIEDIGLSTDSRFTDLDDYVIESLFKLYPLEFLFVERFGPALPRSRIRLIEPPWKTLLSNKGILPLLWHKHRGHPNLLEAHFETGDSEALAPGWVRKPMYSREGANVTLILPDGSQHVASGPYDDSPWVRQAAQPLPLFDGNYAVVGSWVVADRAAGIGIREDTTLITRDTSRFVPHAIVD
ncbi:MAG TPA: glutathionylspermidine synthase family protein [Tahibacter sp.]|uniref:glutathionylspermidine synthase family protein n=1 Tax=Tahibacter sp. TaxID=2056211 RepID=UPI002B7B082F|nr:glutathionylspermidine synthase family protein [Tahibacter sp.]HSX60129.1 glutathionylspermidine synthase family protein [Tahibacter sp.]